MNNTLNYYNQNATKLYKRYNSADMSELHQLLLKYIPKNSSVLDIGFGSGRDLSFLNQYDYDIWGIDPTKKFVENMQIKFPSLKEHFYTDKLPTFSSSILNKKFDAVISIAMFMHLQRSDYESTVKTISNLCKSNATVVISFSSGNREDSDERYFEEVDLDYLNDIFHNEGLELSELISQKDGLKRSELVWSTVMYTR